MAPPHTAPFSIKEALRYGWRKTRENLGALIYIGAIGLFLASLNQMLSRPTQAPGTPPLLGLGLVVQVLQAGVTMAFIRTALAVHDGRKPDLSKPSALLAGFWSYLLTSVLYGLIVTAGLLLLLVPGVYWAVKYGLAAFVSVDQRLPPLESLRASSRLTEGARGELLLFALAVLGLNVLGALALGLGLFLTIPTSFLAAAFVFRRLQAWAPLRAVPGPRGPASPTLRDAHA